MKRRSPTTRVGGAYLSISHMSHPPIVVSIIAPSSLFPQNVGSSNVLYLRAPWIIWGPPFFSDGVSTTWSFIKHQDPRPTIFGATRLDHPTYCTEYEYIWRLLFHFKMVLLSRRGTDSFSSSTEYQPFVLGYLVQFGTLYFCSIRIRR